MTGDATSICLYANMQTLTNVLLGWLWRGQRWRRGVKVQVSRLVDTPALPAAPSLNRQTRPVGDWTPYTEEDTERKILNRH